MYNIKNLLFFFTKLLKFNNILHYFVKIVHICMVYYILFMNSPSFLRNVSHLSPPAYHQIKPNIITTKLHQPTIKKKNPPTRVKTNNPSASQTSRIDPRSKIKDPACRNQLSRIHRPASDVRNRLSGRRADERPAHPPSERCGQSPRSHWSTRPFRGPHAPPPSSRGHE